MEAKEYEKFVAKTWNGPSSIEFTSIGFAGEAGEVLNEIKKEIRDQSVRSAFVRDEMGDALYYFTHLARLYGFSLSDIMDANKEKLMSRKVVVKGA